MAGKLKDEIRQNLPFANLEEETFLNIQRTAGLLMNGVEETLRGSALSHPQYNALRILRGAGTAGLTCGEIGSRMVTRDSDITRLVDRLERQGYARRRRSETDRRVIRVYLTKEGAALLHSLDRRVTEAVRRPLSGLGQARLEQLTGLLEEIRIQMEGSASN